MGDQDSCADEHAAQNGGFERGLKIMSDEQAESTGLMFTRESLEQDMPGTPTESVLPGESEAMDGPCSGGVQENTANGVDGPAERSRSIEYMLLDEDFGTDDDDNESFRLPPLPEEGVDGDRPSAGGGQDNAECSLRGPGGQAESGLVGKDVSQGLVIPESKRRRTTSTCVRADGGTVHKPKSTIVTVEYHKPDSTSKTTALGIMGRMIAIPDKENQGQFVDARAMYLLHGGTGGQESTRGEDAMIVVFRDNRVGQYPASKCSEYRGNWCRNALKSGCRVCFNVEYV